MSDQDPQAKRIALLEAENKRLRKRNERQSEMLVVLAPGCKLAALIAKAEGRTT